MHVHKERVLTNGQIVDGYFVVELPETVCALAITEDNQVLLVTQYRHPIEESILELPGGFVDKGEKPDTAIVRELQEETGYQFSDFQYVGRVAGNPGVLNNFTMMYLATGGKKISLQHLDACEEIEVELFSIDKVREMLANNEFKQALHVACLLYAFNKLDTVK